MGLLPGVGQGFICVLDYRSLSVTACVAIDRGRLVSCFGFPSCSRLHSPTNGLTTAIRFRHPSFGWRISYPARFYFFSCRYRAGLVTYYESVLSNFDTRAGRLLEAGRESFPEDGVALRISTFVGGPQPLDVPDTSFPLEPDDFVPEPSFANAENVSSHAFAIDDRWFHAKLYYGLRAPLWHRQTLSGAIRSIRSAARR